jgi:hypothetical protein
MIRLVPVVVLSLRLPPVITRELTHAVGLD